MSEYPEAPIPNFVTGSIETVHRLSVDQRKARRVKNREKRRRAAQRRTGATTGPSTWVKQAKVKRKLDRARSAEPEKAVQIAFKVMNTTGNRATAKTALEIHNAAASMVTHANG